MKPRPWRLDAAAVAGRMIHELKTWPECFDDVALGHKRFEIRRNDRNYRVGDWLLLRAWDPKAEIYFDRVALAVRVLYLVSGGAWGIPDDMVVMSIGGYEWLPGYPKEWAGGKVERYLRSRERGSVWRCVHPTRSSCFAVHAAPRWPAG